MLNKIKNRKKSWLLFAEQEDIKKYEKAKKYLVISWFLVAIIGIEISIPLLLYVLVLIGYIGVSWCCVFYTNVLRDHWPVRIKSALQQCKCPNSKDVSVFRTGKRTFIIDGLGVPVHQEKDFFTRRKRIQSTLGFFITRFEMISSYQSTLELSEEKTQVIENKETKEVRPMPKVVYNADYPEYEPFQGCRK